MGALIALAVVGGGLAVLAGGTGSSSGGGSVVMEVMRFDQLPPLPDAGPFLVGGSHDLKSIASQLRTGLYDGGGAWVDVNFAPINNTRYAKSKPPGMKNPKIHTDGRRFGLLMYGGSWPSSRKKTVYYHWLKPMIGPRQDLMAIADAAKQAVGAVAAGFSGDWQGAAKGALDALTSIADNDREDAAGKVVNSVGALYESIIGSHPANAHLRRLDGSLDLRARYAHISTMSTRDDRKRSGNRRPIVWVPNMP